MTTPVIAEILSPTVEVEIYCFVTSDVKNNDNDCSQTLDLIDSAYKNIKYKKIKDILIYKKRCKWIDKKIIATLEKETEFFETQICSKNEVINKFLNNNIQMNSNNNMEGEIWDSGDIFNTSDTYSVSSAGESWDSLFKFSDVNIISHKKHWLSDENH